MSTKRQRIARHWVQPVSDDVRYLLVTGDVRDAGADFFKALALLGDLDALQRVWLDVRDGVLEDFIDQHPGRRPWAWWKFESTEPRRRRG